MVKLNHHNITSHRRDKIPKTIKHKATEEYRVPHDRRRHWKYYCTECGCYLGSTAPCEQHPTPEQISTSLCDKCRNKPNHK